MKGARLRATSAFRNVLISSSSSKGGRRQNRFQRSRRSQRGQRTPPASTVGNQVRLALSLSLPSPRSFALVRSPALYSGLTPTTSTASLVLFARSPLGNNSHPRRPPRRLPLHLLLRPPPLARIAHLQGPVRRSRQLEGRGRRCCRPDGERVGERGVGGEIGQRGGEGKVSVLILRQHWHESDVDSCLVSLTPAGSSLSLSFLRF